MAKRPSNKGLRIEIRKRKAKHRKNRSTGWDGRTLYNCRCDRCVIKYSRSDELIPERVVNEVIEGLKEIERHEKDKLSKMQEKITFINREEAKNKPENNLCLLGGWFTDGMRWEDYLSRCDPSVHHRLESLRQAIIEHDIRCTGAQHTDEGDGCIPLYEDGTITIYSWRGWGDLMAAVWSSHDNKDYHYMEFFGF